MVEYSALMKGFTVETAVSFSQLILIEQLIFIHFQGEIVSVVTCFLYLVLDVCTFTKVFAYLFLKNEDLAADTE